MGTSSCTSTDSCRSTRRWCCRRGCISASPVRRAASPTCIGLEHPDRDRTTASPAASASSAATSSAQADRVRLVGSDGGIFNYGGRLLRVDRWHAPQPSDCRDGHESQDRWLLVGRVRRWRVRFQRTVLRLDGRDASQRADRGYHGDARRRRLLDGRVRRGHLRVRQRPLPRLNGRAASRTAHRRDRGKSGNRWVLARCVRRRHLRVRCVVPRMAGARQLNTPISGMASMPDGRGYRLVGTDGAVFAYGNAASYGSPVGHVRSGRITGIAVSGDGRGYWLAGADGAGCDFGNAGSWAGRRQSAEGADRRDQRVTDARICRGRGRARPRTVRRTPRAHAPPIGSAPVRAGRGRVGQRVRVADGNRHECRATSCRSPGWPR